MFGIRTTQKNREWTLSCKHIHTNTWFLPYKLESFPYLPACVDNCVGCGPFRSICQLQTTSYIYSLFPASSWPCLAYSRGLFTRTQMLQHWAYTVSSICNIRAQPYSVMRELTRFASCHSLLTFFHWLHSSYSQISRATVTPLLNLSTYILVALPVTTVTKVVP